MTIIGILLPIIVLMLVIAAWVAEECDNIVALIISISCIIVIIASFYFELTAPMIIEETIIITDKLDMKNVAISFPSPYKIVITEHKVSAWYASSSRDYKEYLIKCLEE